jgi:hypothetical protein
MFDFTRCDLSTFGGWSNLSGPTRLVDGDPFYRMVVEPGYASYIRGCQLVRAAVSKEEVIRRSSPGTRREVRQYASFIAHDWKNGAIREISCGPGHTANSFTESKLPFELSPAFFRPDVLIKYKADSDKYRLEDRSISCRGAWHLQTYDVNDAGKVHTYLVYLRSLLCDEQQHWKAYNEEAPISKRALGTDFEGRRDLEYDPLVSLRSVIQELHRKHVPGWTLRAEELIDHVRYPVTSSADEWSNEVPHLDQLVVEGFEEKWRRTTLVRISGLAPS